MGEPIILVVSERHWPYRYAPFFYAHWLDWAAEHDPELRARVKLAFLPTELPSDAAVVHAWVQDPERERNDVTYAHLTSLEAQARRADAHVIQPVDVLSNSLRLVQHERLTRAGVRTPRVVRIGPGFARDLGGLTLPILVRKNWGHADVMLRLDSAAQVEQWLESHGPGNGEWVATEYIDVRSADGNYRKYRYVLFGERGVCRHLIVSPEWEVRPSSRVLTETTIAEELGFVEGACGAHDLLNAARRELGFDIAAFDYSFDSDGAMIVWEVNPYPDLSRPRGRPGEYLRESMHRTNVALAALYRDRLAAALGAVSTR